MIAKQNLHSDIDLQAEIDSLPVTMSKREQNKHAAIELYYDIISYMSVLYKMGFDNCVDVDVLFVEMLNETGFRTPQGHEFTNASYRHFMGRMEKVVGSSVRDVLRGNV